MDQLLIAVSETEHPKLRGQRSEAAVLHAFVSRKIPVLQPFGDNERSLRIEDPEKASPNVNWAADFGVDSWISSRE